jgi:dihydropyrimidine dehydrogenase (NAD+) subunit PreA
MEHFLEDQGYSSYNDIIGISLPNIRPAAELDPVLGAPVVDLERCNGCGLCEKPGHCTAVTIVNGKAVIDESQCYGCGICIAMCNRKALAFPA